MSTTQAPATGSAPAAEEVETGGVARVVRLDERRRPGAPAAVVDRASARHPAGRAWRAGGPRRGASALSRGRGALKEAGMATAEYAIATLAAVGFAGLLLVILRSGEVRTMLTSLIRRALSVSG
ncbi:MAG: DUF4244 domain-containing protein [Kineosporiaceae bacterium]